LNVNERRGFLAKIGSFQKVIIWKTYQNLKSDEDYSNFSIGIRGETNGRKIFQNSVFATSAQNILAMDTFLAHPSLQSILSGKLCEEPDMSLNPDNRQNGDNKGEYLSH